MIVTNITTKADDFIRAGALRIRLCKTVVIRMVITGIALGITQFISLAVTNKPTVPTPEIPIPVFPTTFYGSGAGSFR